MKDDFILALLAARGGAAAVTLTAATFGLILVSGVVALGAEDPAQPSARRERAGMLGGAMLWMLVIQAGVVLGSATGGLPVMGQPLPLVAAAGSHLLFFCIPAVAVVLSTSRERARDQACVSGRSPVSTSVPSFDEPITVERLSGPVDSRLRRGLLVAASW